jgi:Ca2+-binding RTX toxin-like protein
MARIVLRSINGSEGIALTPFTMAGLLDYEDVRVSSAEVRLYDDALNFSSFTGTGFRFTMVDGLPLPTAGTITGLRVVAEGVRVAEITGWNVDLQSFYADMAGGDYAGALNRLVGGNDTIIGSAGSDFLGAGTGRDVVEGGRGADRIEGGRGDDRLFGESGNDELLGQAGTDYLSGGAGHDRLIGGSGNDTLRGGSGTDRLTGGTGRDVFVFGAADGSGNRITDFTEGQDRIRIAAAGRDFDDVTITGSGSDNVVLQIGSTRIIVEDGQAVGWDAGDFLFS